MKFLPLIFSNLFYQNISLTFNTLQKTNSSFQWILDQFKNQKEYADWVKETTAKEIGDIITPHDVDMLEV